MEEKHFQQCRKYIDVLCEIYGPDDGFFWFSAKEYGDLPLEDWFEYKPDFEYWSLVSRWKLPKLSRKQHYHFPKCAKMHDWILDKLGLKPETIWTRCCRKPGTKPKTFWTKCCWYKSKIILDEDNIDDKIVDAKHFKNAGKILYEPLKHKVFEYGKYIEKKKV